MIEQRTPEWLAARLGKVTASRICDVMARTRSGYGASRANYMAELVCERLTGFKAEGFTSVAMQWGIDQEAAAKAAYAFVTDAALEECGFFDHPTVPMSGASPDGTVGRDGLVEVKCPNTASHIDTLLSEVIDDKYHLQMQWQMACAGRNWCDFVSFDPRMPAEMHLWIKRVARDDRRIAEIEKEVRTFLDELDTKVAKLQSRFGGAFFENPIKKQLEASLA